MTKKLLSLLVAAAMLLAIIPAAALAKTEAAAPAKTDAIFRAAEPVKDEFTVSWDFEADPAENGWQFVDADGDGNNWNWNNGAANAHSGSYSIMSASYSGAVLTPDNWAISPRFTLPQGGATLSFWVMNYSSSYPETFGVYVVNADAENIALLENQTVSGAAYVEVTADLSDYAGQEISVALRHYNCSDQWRFYIDDVTVTGGVDNSVIRTAEADGFKAPLNGMTAGDLVSDVTVPAGANYVIEERFCYDCEMDMPMDNFVELRKGKEYMGVAILVPLDGFTFAEDVQLIANSGDMEVYEYCEITPEYVWLMTAPMECVDAPVAGWYFEEQEELEGWTVYDADGDSNNWGWYCGDSVAEYAFEGMGFIGSLSYGSTGALTPDNYIMTPAITIPEGVTTLTFYAAGVGESYCEEHLAAYVTTNSDITATGDMIEVLPETVMTAEYQLYSVDLSDYAGQTIYFAIRHFNCSDMNLLRVDQLEVRNEKEPITAIEVNGFVVPAWGEHPCFELTVPDGAHYSINYVDWTSFGNGFNVLGEDDVFDDPAAQYTMYVELIPEEGYDVAEDAVALINGSQDYVDQQNYGYNAGAGYFYINTIPFTVTEPEPQTQVIDTVYVNGFDIPPVAGENSAEHLNLTVPEDAVYYVQSANWFNEDAYNYFSGNFNAGTHYSVNAVLYLPEGYEFANVVTIYVNGDTSLVSENVYNYGDVLSFYTVPFECVEANADDLDAALNVEGGTLHFESTGEYPWATFTDGDRLAAWSTNNGVASSTSVLSTTVTANAGDTLSFDFMAWGEGGYTYWDKCEFIVDGEVVMQWGAYQNNEWETYEYEFTADGEHTVVWSYTKDSSVNPNGDFFAVDEVQVVEGVPEDPYAIHAVYVDGFGTPVAGVVGIDHVFLTTPEDAPYFLAYAGWLDETDQQQLWNEDHVFIPGHMYSEGCQVWAEDGYYFADDCVFYANGGTELIDAQWSYIDDEYNWICYINIIPVECEGASGILGDVDLNGTVEVADALLAMRYAMGLIDLTDEQLAQMDVDGNGVYDLVDATLIMRCAMGLIPPFTAE